MIREDILRMAREAGIQAEPGNSFADDMYFAVLYRFASLIAAAQREKVAHWMRSLGYATGHGDTTEDLLDHLGTQISEGLEVEVLMEREACAKVCEGIGDGNKWSDAHDCAAAIRARNNT